MKITITLEQIIALKPCERYVENGNALLLRLAAGRTECELSEILRRADIPVLDRIWLATRDGVLPPAVRQEWTEGIVTRAVRVHALGTSIDAWAQKWLSGEDRSAALAEEAALAARAEAEAAEAAALAARAEAEEAEATAAAEAGAAWLAAARAQAAAETAWAAAAARKMEYEKQITELLEIIERSET